MTNIFKGPTQEVAQRLLGCELIKTSPQGVTGGIIVETESYLQDDPACHGAKRKTKRNEAMFNEAGTAYVYFTYGMHHCFNIVTNKEGIPEAVLIRALQPTQGLELMKQRRQTQNIKNVCSGPAKLVQAMNINMNDNKTSLLTGPIRIQEYKPIPPNNIVTTTRIGIRKAQELPLRYYIKDNPWVSRI